MAFAGKVGIRPIMALEKGAFMTETRGQQIARLKKNEADMPTEEFTREVRTVLGDPQRIPARLKTLTDYLYEACDRLDALNTQKEELILEHGALMLEINIVKGENAKLKELAEPPVGKFTERAQEPLLTWDKPRTSYQAAKYLMTNGFVAVELYRVQQKEIEKLTAENKAQAEGLTKARLLNT